MSTETETTTELLDRLDALHKAATPLPWKRWIHDPDDPYSSWGVVAETGDIAHVATDEDAAYIVEACNSVPELVRRLRVAEKQLQRARSTLNGLANRKIRRNQAAVYDSAEMALEDIAKMGETP